MRSGGVAPDQRGFALLAVLMVLALLSVVVSEFAFSMRLETAMVRSYRDAILARHLAEAGVQQGIREVLNDATVHGLDEDGQVVFYQVVAGSTATPKQLPELPRSRVRLGAGEFSYRITDEEARINLNSGKPALLDKLLMSLGVDKEQRDTITDSIEDWRDSNDAHRVNGAESDDYLQLPVPYRARNTNLQDVAELLQIKGVTPELYYGSGDQPGLVDLVTVRSRGTFINLNTAPKLVLEAAGLAEAEIDDILQSRAAHAYASVPTRYTARGFTVGTATFRIEAEGLIAGEPRARLVAIVRRVTGPQTGSAPTLAVYSWRPLPPKSSAKKEASTGDGSGEGPLSPRG